MSAGADADRAHSMGFTISAEIAMRRDDRGGAETALAIDPHNVYAPTVYTDLLDHGRAVE
jgi:hypothetical protein